MQHMQSKNSVSVVWRGKKFIVEINSDATLQELGLELQKLTEVKAETMRLIVPLSSNRGSKLLLPFSDEQSSLSLNDNGIIEGKPIRMMGVSEDEVDEVLQSEKKDLRIAGFEEEEKRYRQRSSIRPQTSLRLPQGPYVFCDFQTLNIPGIELNPPPSEALKRMHMLAADPGIVAIMNKHRWRVGIMTEMAPVGYVGVSPKCILGFNKNHGEEISLRLRTDDLKGFRKYESIKKTLLHELAHMVHSEHDANFYALDKQLNQEAASLDWTRSRGHTLGGFVHSEELDESFDAGESNHTTYKLGGSVSDHLASARESSVAAAYRRLASADRGGFPKECEEPDPDDSNVLDKPDPIDALEGGNIESNGSAPINFSGGERRLKTDFGDTEARRTFEPDYYSESNGSKVVSEISQTISQKCGEPDPDDMEITKSDQLCDQKMGILGSINLSKLDVDEPDPDDSESSHNRKGSGSGSVAAEVLENQGQKEPDPDESQATRNMQVEPDPDENLGHSVQTNKFQENEPDPDDQDLQRIQHSVTVICNRLQQAIEMLRCEVGPVEAATVLKTLSKIIRNVIEHPEDMKFKKLRKANPTFQRNVEKYKAAMNILHLIGFIEDVIWDEIGRAETYLILKRNDPGLLWLAKSSLETGMAC